MGLPSDSPTSGMPALKWFVAVFLVAALTEAFVALDLVPIAMLLPRSGLLVVVAALSIVVLLASLGFFLIRGESRFSMRSILAIAVVVGWPLARIANEIRSEAHFASNQQTCLASLEALPAKQVTFAGRYNDGRNDHVIQVWLFRFVVQFIDQNDLRHEVAYMRDVDVSDTELTPEHLRNLANVGSRSAQLDRNEHIR